MARMLIGLVLLCSACGAGLTLAQAQTALDRAREAQALACSQANRPAWFERCRLANEGLKRAQAAVDALEALDAGAE